MTTKFHIDLRLICWVFWTPSLSYLTRVGLMSARIYKHIEPNDITRKRKHRSAFFN